MKRNSQNVHADIVRITKRTKTVGAKGKKGKKINLPSYQTSQIVSLEIVNDLLEVLDGKMNVLGEAEALKKLSQSCFTMFNNVITFGSPENHEDEIKEISEDKEPSRISFDPICGFDKLKTCKNGPKVESQTICPSQIRTPRTAFGVFQQGKKQFLKSQQLVPLVAKKNMENDHQTAQEALYRERLIEMYLNFEGESKSKAFQNEKHLKPSQTIKNSPLEECQYDYNGEKIPLIAGKTSMNSRMVPSNVLKTSYRILEQISMDGKIGRKMSNKIPSLDRKNNQVEIINRKPNTIETTREKSLQKPSFPTGQDQSIKNLLEAKFKDTKAKLRQLESRPQPIIQYPSRVSRMM